MNALASLAPGFLLAAPRLGDPNFNRSVVLLGQHDEESALGWVLNGHALASVRDLLADAKLVPAGVVLPRTASFVSPVRVGGPVQQGSVWLLYRRVPSLPEYPIDYDLGNGFAVTPARTAVEALARGEGPEDFRLYLGYAGWGPHQLEGEIQAGAWLPAALDTGLLFENDADSLWEAAYKTSVGAPPEAFGGPSRGSA